MFKKSKRALSLLIALVLVIGMLPLAAFAAISDYYPNTDNDPTFEFNGTTAIFEAEALDWTDGKLFQEFGTNGENNSYNGLTCEAASGGTYMVPGLALASSTVANSYADGKFSTKSGGAYAPVTGYSVNASYKINVTSAGTYYVWLRASAVTSSNQIWVGANNAGFVKTTKITDLEADINLTGTNKLTDKDTLVYQKATKFVWMKVSSWSLAAGVNTIDLVSGSRGLLIDQIAVTSDANYTPVSTATELTAALEAATNGTTIGLAGDITVDAAVTVPAGVTLDLNGNDLVAPSANAAAATAKVIDSVGGGIVTVAKEAFTGNGDNGGYLPLYNTTGYSFYKVTMEAKDNGTAGENAAKLRFKVNASAAAYALIANGGTGMEIKGQFAGASTASGSIKYADEQKDFVKEWAAFAAEKDGAVVIYVVLSGLDQVNGTLTMTPSVYNAGVSIAGSALTAK